MRPKKISRKQLERRVYRMSYFLEPMQGFHMNDEQDAADDPGDPAGPPGMAQGVVAEEATTTTTTRMVSSLVAMVLLAVALGVRAMLQEGAVEVEGGVAAVEGRAAARKAPGLTMYC
jgi:hypothetical protein